MIMLFGGPVLITLAYIGALAASVQAFGGGPGVVLIGAVYLAAAAIAAAAPARAAWARSRRPWSRG